MFKKILSCLLIAGVVCSLVGCSNKEISNNDHDSTETIFVEMTPSPSLIERADVDFSKEKSGRSQVDGTQIVLSDDVVIVDGTPATDDITQSVYVANDIVYYHDNMDLTYGEGDKDESHTEGEAAAHKVVHITKPGNYILTGHMSAGQIAIDLGDSAKMDENAVVNLYLNGINVTCSVAPAIIFYNVYECGANDESNHSMAVDTSLAGANIVIVDESINLIDGSHVAKIYKEGSVELNGNNSKVINSETKHKYDAAVYSRMTMNLSGEENGNGALSVKADNEGIGSEFHLTINGGVIYVNSYDDCINANQDNVSVVAINDGEINLSVNIEAKEGDGIDSNGWIVINGGLLRAQSCFADGEMGLDSSCGLYINGGAVFSTGHTYNHIINSIQPFALFHFNKSRGTNTCLLKNSDGELIVDEEIVNDFVSVLISTSKLTPGEYGLWVGDIQYAGVKKSHLVTSNDLDNNDLGAASKEFVIDSTANYFYQCWRSNNQ